MNPTDLFALMQQDPQQAQELMEAAISERAASDPRFGMLMQMFSRRAQPEALPSRDPVTEQLEDLKAALTNAYDQLDELALGLGACATCWGDDDGCRTCQGRGRPGWRMPDAKTFRALIAPAMRRRAALTLPTTETKHRTDQREGNDP